MRRRRWVLPVALIATMLAAGGIAQLLPAPTKTAPGGRAAPNEGMPQRVPGFSPASIRGQAPAVPSTSDYYRHTWLDGHPSPPLPIQARSAVLVDLGSRQQLWARSATDSLPPASLTKLMTVAVALRHARLDTPVTVPQAATQLEGDAMVMGLSAGEVLTVRELLYGVFMESANDAAEALAQGVEPRPTFLADMNRLAAAWGLGASHFSNPTGLDDPGLRSSAYDLAVIAGHLLDDHQELLAISGAKEMTLPATATHKSYQLGTVIGLVLHDYPGANGLKTGFTDDAGFCISGTATRGSRHLLAVVLNSPTDVDDAKRLLDYGFSTTVASA
jgi:serine-type D-Ala-D-Ala carboxypeptidase (penicillin-binding protein 5/6)